MPIQLYLVAKCVKCGKESKTSVAVGNVREAYKDYIDVWREQGWDIRRGVDQGDGMYVECPICSWETDVDI